MLRNLCILCVFSMSWIIRAQDGIDQLFKIMEALNKVTAIYDMWH